MPGACLAQGGPDGYIKLAFCGEQIESSGPCVFGAHCQAQFRTLFRADPFIQACADCARGSALRWGIAWFSSNSRLLDVPAGAARALYRFGARAAPSAARRDTVGQAQSE